MTQWKIAIFDNLYLNGYREWHTYQKCINEALLPQATWPIIWHFKVEKKLEVCVWSQINSYRRKYKLSFYKPEFSKIYSWKIEEKSFLIEQPKLDICCYFICIQTVKWGNFPITFPPAIFCSIFQMVSSRNEERYP